MARSDGKDVEKPEFHRRWECEVVRWLGGLLTTSHRVTQGSAVLRWIFALEKGKPRSTWGFGYVHSGCIHSSPNWKITRVQEQVGKAWSVVYPCNGLPPGNEKTRAPVPDDTDASKNIMVWQRSGLKRIHTVWLDLRVLECVKPNCRDRKQVIGFWGLWVRPTLTSMGRRQEGTFRDHGKAPSVC